MTQILPPARITVLLHLLQVGLTLHVISKHLLEIESLDLEDRTLLEWVWICHLAPISSIA